MRILLAPDCYSGTLTAPQASAAMAEGWAAGAPDDSLRQVPLADGGPGFLEVLHQALGGTLVPVTVTGPSGVPTPAAILVVDGDPRPVAYVESAHAVGLHLVPQDERDPAVTTTAGLGELLRAALDLEVGRVVVGIGGTATNDAGAGLLAGLGVGGSRLRSGGLALAEVGPADLAGIHELREELSSVDLVIAADVDVPLLGLHGASAGFAAQKGASPETAQGLERALGHFAHVLDRAVGDRPVTRDLLVPAAPGGRGGTGYVRELAQLPGAGAGGGAGFALAVLGGRVLPGADVVGEAVGLGRAVAACDLVITGEGMLDWQSLHGKVVSAVAAQGLRHGVPVVAVPGQAALGRREWAAAGLAGVYPVAERPAQVPAAMADPAGTLRSRVARVARTWSR